MTTTGERIWGTLPPEIQTRIGVAAVDLVGAWMAEAAADEDGCDPEEVIKYEAVSQERIDDLYETAETAIRNHVIKETIDTTGSAA